MQTNEPDTGSFKAITTLEDLGRYLQKLRKKRHVTQESLSMRTAAIAGRKIARSRISEIENAKRDQVTKDELRAYMHGLRCTPRHIDHVTEVLRHCTATSARESPDNPDATSPSPATPDAYLAGLGGAEDDLTPREEKSDDDPAAAGHEEEERERWRQVNTRTNPLTASPPQPSRRRWQHHRIAFAAAVALVALGGLGAEYVPPETGDRPTSPGGPTVLSVPHNTPRISEDTSNFVKGVTFPNGTPLRANQRSTKTPEIRNWLAGRGDAAGGDVTQHQIEVVSVTPCCGRLAGQRWPGTTPQDHSGNIVGSGAPDVRGHGARMMGGDAGDAVGRRWAADVPRAAAAAGA